MGRCLENLFHILEGNFARVLLSLWVGVNVHHLADKHVSDHLALLKVIKSHCLFIYFDLGGSHLLQLFVPGQESLDGFDANWDKVWPRDVSVFIFICEGQQNSNVILIQIIGWQ